MVASILIQTHEYMRNVQNKKIEKGIFINECIDQQDKALSSLQQKDPKNKTIFLNIKQKQKANGKDLIALEFPLRVGCLHCL